MARRGSTNASGHNMTLETVRKQGVKTVLSENDKATFSNKLNILSKMSLEGDKIFKFLAIMQQCFVVSSMKHALYTYCDAYADEINTIIEQAEKIDAIKKAIVNKNRILEEMPKYVKVLQNNIERLQQLIKTGQSNLDFIQLKEDKEHIKDVQNKRDEVKANMSEVKESKANIKYSQEKEALLAVFKKHNADLSKMELTGDLRADVKRMRVIRDKIVDRYMDIELHRRNWERNRSLMREAQGVLNKPLCNVEQLTDSKLNEVYGWQNVPDEYYDYTRWLNMVFYACIEDSKRTGDLLVMKSDIMHYLHAESELNGRLVDRIKKLAFIIPLLNELSGSEMSNIQQIYEALDVYVGIDKSALYGIYELGGVKAQRNLAEAYRYLSKTTKYDDKLPKLAFQFKPHPDIACASLVQLAYMCKLDTELKNDIDNLVNRKNGVKRKELIEEEKRKREEEERKRREEIVFEKNRELLEYIEFFDKLFPGLDILDDIDDIQKCCVEYGVDIGENMYKLICYTHKPTIKYNWNNGINHNKLDIIRDMYRIYNGLYRIIGLDGIAEKDLIAILHNKYPNHSVEDIIQLYVTAPNKIYKLENPEVNTERTKEESSSDKKDDTKVKKDDTIDVKELKLRKKLELLNEALKNSTDVQSIREIKFNITKTQYYLDEVIRYNKAEALQKSKDEAEKHAEDVCKELIVDYTNTKTDALEKWPDKKKEIMGIISLKRTRLNMLASYTNASYEQALIVADADRAYTKLFS